MTYVEGTFTYPSSIDSGIVNLYGKYCYRLEDTLPPPYILMHAYGGDADSVSQTTMRRFADAHVCAISLGLRGNNGASGSKDSAGRERYDIYDGLVYCRANLPIHQTKCGMHGWSAGGGLTLATMCSFPEMCQSWTSMFGISDWGWDVYNGWWWQTQSHRSELVAQIGSRETEEDAYRARNIVESLASRMTFGGNLELFHDTLDGDVPVIHSQRVVETLESWGITGFQYHQSQPGDAIRWLHGYPDQFPDNILAEPYGLAALALEDEFSFPVIGSVPVLGFLHTSNFEVWFGDQAHPRTNGRTVAYAAQVTWDFPNGRFYIEPYSPTPFWVQIITADRFIDMQINGPTDVNINALPTDTIASFAALSDNVLELHADSGIVLNGADVASWDTYASATNQPLFVADAGDGHPAVEFDSTNSERLDGPNLFDGGADWTIMLLCKPAAVDGMPFSQGNSGSLNGFVYIRHLAGTTAAGALGVDSGASFEILEALSSVGSWHVLTFGQRDGELFYEVDGFAYANATGSNLTTTTDVSALGCLRRALRAGFWSGQIRSVGVWDRALLAQEIYQARQFLAAKWP